MTDGILLALMVVVGAVTFLYRYAMIGMFAHRELPTWLEKLCWFVAPASFAALVTSTLFVSGQQVELDLASPRLWAAVVAAVVAWRTGHVFATIATGMGVLYLLKWLL